MSPTPFDCCRICTLIFNRHPIEIGRSTIGPTICIICEVNMETNTRTKIIKVHTLVIDDTEIEAYLNDPGPLIDTLRDLLIARPTENGNGHTPAGNGQDKPRAKRGPMKQRKLPDRVPCQACGESIPAYKQGRHKCKITALVGG